MVPAVSGTILIVTHGRDDDHVARVSRELARRGTAPVRLDTDRYPDEVEFTFAASETDTETAIGLRGRTLAGSEVVSILYRHRSIPRTPGIDDPQGRAMAEGELLALIDGTLLALPAFWVNHPAANRLAAHKPLQLALAAEAGFRLPPTRITRDPAVVRQVYAEWGGEMVAKLVGGQVVEAPGEEAFVIYTSRIAEADLLDEAAIAACPAIYQRMVPKAGDVRVTVVGDRIFSCYIPAAANGAAEVDWRRAWSGSSVVPYEIDDLTASRCRRLTRRLGLEVAGIDLLLTPSGDIVFLEVNAAGQWAWVEEATGMPIAAAVADRLLEGPGER
jgi:hypothetical protein